MAKKIVTKFEARLWAAQYEAKEDAKRNLQNYVPIGAVKGDFWSKAPAPGMYYDTDVNMWCPESFKVEKAGLLRRKSSASLTLHPTKITRDIPSPARNLFPMSR